MKILPIALLILISPSIGFSQDSQEKKDADQIKEMIKKNGEEMRNTGKLSESNMSAKGAHDFWSSGGMLVDLKPDFQYKFDEYNLAPKHITVISLVPGKAAVAAYYNEGTFKPTNGNKVDHYLCRVTTVFVNENGKWKARHSHFSPVQGGSGTTQTSVDE